MPKVTTTKDRPKPKMKDSPELLAARIENERLGNEIIALRQALEASQVPAPILERAVAVETGWQRLCRVMGW